LLDVGFVLMDLCVYSLPPLDLHYLLFAARGVASAMHVVKIGGLWMNDESLFFLAWFVFWVFAWLVLLFGLLFWWFCVLFFSYAIPTKMLCSGCRILIYPHANWR